MEGLKGGDRFTCGLAIASYAFSVGMILAFPPAAITAGAIGLMVGTTAFGMLGVSSSCYDRPFSS